VALGAVRAAYSATGAAWQVGPGPLYDRLAEVLVARAPAPLAGRRVLDVGAGTGAASRAILRAGGHPLALDLALGMLTVQQRARPPAAAADAGRLPVATGSCGAVVAAFSYNHVADPAGALAEAARALEPGGVILASAYAAGDHHPAKAAVDTAAGEVGWRPPAWVDELRGSVQLELATVAGATAAMRRAGLRGDAVVVEVAFPELGPREVVGWRLGMASLAPFVATLSSGARRRLEARALELLPDDGVLTRRMVVLRAQT
jgi:SAM-dependent methyltransferase